MEEQTSYTGFTKSSAKIEKGFDAGTSHTFVRTGQRRQDHHLKEASLRGRANRHPHKGLA